MAILPYLKLAMQHPEELRSVINLKMWREPLNDFTAHPETSGVDRPVMKRCWELLDLTSRSFAMVVKELQGDLCRATCIFYLVLRALDTVEDDMSLEINLKLDLLESFYKKLEQPGWTFDGSGPNEKDRQVLVEFDKVIEEYGLLDPKYRQVISTICRKMGFGMAHYCRVADQNNNTFSVQTLSEFDLYCHYVAGLVGEGLSMLFSSSGLERPELGLQLTLSNSMGLLLQKNNILRDFREDVNDGRLFWPKEIWGKYVTNPLDLCKPENEQKARWALSEMTLDVLQHAVDALEYLSMLRNQSVFNFCAIPQVMAVATVDECFGNLDVFHKHVKIRRSYTCHLILKTTNPKNVAEIFIRHLDSIHNKMRADDPSFLKLASTIARVVQWTENRYPSWINLGSAIPSSYVQAAEAGITDNRIRQLPIKQIKLTPGQQKYAQNDDQTLQILIFALVTVAAVAVLMFLPVLVYLGWAKGADGNPIIDYRKILAPSYLMAVVKDYGTKAIEFGRGKANEL